MTNEERQINMDKLENSEFRKKRNFEAKSLPYVKPKKWDYKYIKKDKPDYKKIEAAGIEIENKVYQTELMHWKRLKLFQNINLKEVKEEDFEKLKNSLLDNSFIDVFKVWEDPEDGSVFVIDGHHRIKALYLLENEGVKIPAKLTCNFIKFETREEAASALLSYCSEYAKVTEEGLYEFIETENLKSEDLSLKISIPGINIEEFNMGYYGDLEIPMERTDREEEPGPITLKKCPSCGHEWEG